MISELTPGEAWEKFEAMPKEELVTAASLPGFGFVPETARAELRMRLVYERHEKQQETGGVRADS